MGIRGFKMKNTKGLTLLEVVVSLFIVSLIAMGFYTMFSTVFINTYKTSELTEKIFAAQEDVEEKIAVTKGKIKTGETDDLIYPSTTIKLFAGQIYERDVEGFVMENDINNFTLSTFVSKSRPDPFRVPTIIEDITITGYDGAGRVVTYPNIGHTTLEVVPSVMVLDYTSYHIDTKYEWYHSVEKSYIPFHGFSDDIIDDDLKVIPYYTGKTITNLGNIADYGGTFIKQLTTPVGEKGHFGPSKFSNNIFISRFPIAGNSVLIHMDASYLDMTNTDVMLSTQYNLLKRWTDIGSNNISYQDIENTNSAPYVMIETVGNEEHEHQIISIENSGNSNNQNVDNWNSISTRSKIIVYFALKFEELEGDVTANSTLFDSYPGRSTNKFAVTIVDNNQLRFNLHGQSSISSYQSNFTLNDYRTGGWEIYRLEVEPNRLAVTNGLNVEVNEVTGQRTFNFDQSQSITISSNNRNNISIQRLRAGFVEGHRWGEIIIFDGTGSNHTDNHTQKVLEYLFDKYIID